MGCSSGCGCSGGSSGVIMLTVAATVTAGIIGASVFGFTRDDTKKDDGKTTPKQATPAPAATPPAAPADGKDTKKDVAEKPDPYVLGFTMKDIDGKDQDLAQYKGKVILIVNVASECGYTGQYKGLEALYEAKKDKGLVLLGFPANNFKGQEPGKDSEIKAFCTSKFGVTFPMFSKISVKGDDAHPLFKKLTAVAGEPGWNFNKYLVDKNGNVLQRYESRVTPEDSALVNKVDELLSK